MGMGPHWSGQASIHYPITPLQTHSFEAHLGAPSRLPGCLLPSTSKLLPVYCIEVNSPSLCKRPNDSSQCLWSPSWSTPVLS